MNDYLAEFLVGNRDLYQDAKVIGITPSQQYTGGVDIHLDNDYKISVLRNPSTGFIDIFFIHEGSPNEADSSSKRG